jgi:hypothetical protein
MLYERARNAKRTRYDQWWRNYRLLHNRIGGTAVESWMPAPKSSEIYPIIATLVAYMADQHTNITVTASASPHTPFSQYMQTLAQDLTDILSTNWENLNYQSQVKLCLWDAFMFGAGILKSVWDASYDEGLGNAMLRRVHPFSFYPDPDAKDMDDIEYCVEVKRMSLEELERRFPGSRTTIEALGGADESMDEQPTLLSATRGVSTGTPNTFTIGGDGRLAVRLTPTSKPGPGVVVYEYWVKENEEWWEDEYPEKEDAPPLYSDKHVAERWRVTVVCAGEILLDEYADELWSHKSHPYDRYVADDVGEFYGISLIDHLAYPQIYINRLLTALQMNSELVGNPILIEPENSNPRAALGNKPGQRWGLKGTAPMQNKPEWLQPPSMPPQVQQLLDFWIARMENVAGISAAMKGQSSSSSQGAAPGSRTAQGVMSTIQESTYVRVRSMLANLESTLESVGRKLSDLIIDNFTQPRYMAILGNNNRTGIALNYRHFSVPTEHGATPLKYALVIDAGSDQPTSLQARSAKAEKFYMMGAIDDEALLEDSNFKNWRQVIDRKRVNIAKGLFAPPGARQRTQRQQ